MNNRKYLKDNVETAELCDRMEEILCELCGAVGGEKYSEELYKEELLRKLAELYAVAKVFLDSEDISYINGFSDCFLEDWAAMIEHRNDLLYIGNEGDND